MALFYQINFTSERHARINILRWCALFLVLCFLAGSAYFANYLYEETKQPVLGPRLDTYQSHVTQVTQTLADWKRAEAGWLEVRPYVEQEGQFAPADMLRSLEALAQMGEQPSPDGCPHAFLPERLEIRRVGGVVLTGEASLPEHDKVAHCTHLASLVAGYVTNTVGCVSNTVTADVFPLTPRSFKFDWAKPVPGPDDVRMKATLTAAFATGKPLAFKSPPAELERQLGEAKAWHAKVSQCMVEVTPGKKEKVEAAMSRLLSENKAGLGDSYERIKAFAETAVNPMAVSREIGKTLGNKVPGSLAAFDRAWSVVAQERLPWRRVKELDNPALDGAIANLGVWLDGVLPRKQVFEAIQSKNLAYINALTNGVQRQFIEQEHTFWKDVLKPTLTVREGLVPSETQKATLDAKDKTARVSFPSWSASISETKEASSDKIGKSPSFADLSKVLMNVETNSVGTWVTAVTVEFDKTQNDPKSRWDRLARVTVEGRVPCWMGDGTPQKK